MYKSYPPIEKEEEINLKVQFITLTGHKKHDKLSVPFDMINEVLLLVVNIERMTEEPPASRGLIGELWLRPSGSHFSITYQLIWHAQREAALSFFS